MSQKQHLFIKKSSFGLLGVSVVALAVSVGVAYVALNVQGATAFVIRGDVMQLDKGNGNFHVYIRLTNSAAEHFAGETHEINAKSATFYEYDSAGNKVRSTFGRVIDRAGREVVVQGTVDGSNSFKATSVVRNDNTVKIRGYVRGQSTADNYLEIEIDQVLLESTGKAYKEKIFTKGTKVVVYYDEDSTKFKSRGGASMNEDEFSNNDEKVTLQKVEVKSGSRFEADASATITDGKWLF